MKTISEWKRDVIYSIALLIVAGIGFWQSYTIPAGTVKLKMARPGPYMRFWLLMVALFAIAVMVRALKNKSEKQVATAFNIVSLVTVIALAVYLFVLKTLGFLISTFALMEFLTMYYTVLSIKAKGQTVNKVKTIVCVTIFAVLMTAFAWWIFARLLTVVLPSGTIFD